MAIWQLLIQFIFRLTFGVALAMSVTPSKWVTSGFYRVHLWVLLGLNTFVSLAIYSQREVLSELVSNWQVALGLGITLAFLSYVGSVIWLYERTDLGGGVLVLITTLGFLAAAFATSWDATSSTTGVLLGMLDLASSGVLLGVTLAAMLLGHWYLNTPTMELLPLKRLILFMVAAIIARTVVSGAGLVLHSRAATDLESAFWIFVGFRWLSGLLATLMLGLLTWQTLKVPNTQSATGILYAGVILTFLGELTSQILSVDALYPL